MVRTVSHRHWVNSSQLRPAPFLLPPRPNGVKALSCNVWSLMCTTPVANLPASTRPRSTDPVCTAATSPYPPRLATSTASSSSATTMTGATGPKISWVNAGMSAVTPVSTVGR